MGATPFPGLLHFTLEVYLIMLSVKQGVIKYHFLSLIMIQPEIKHRSPGPLVNTLLLSQWAGNLSLDEKRFVLMILSLRTINLYLLVLRGNNIFIIINDFILHHKKVFQHHC